MPPELLARIFDPLFTTKQQGKGTGLGLSMIYGFAKQSGGLATIDSTEGKGTTVTIYLPRIPEVVFAMLACAKLGEVHSVIFAGLPSKSATRALV